MDVLNSQISLIRSWFYLREVWDKVFRPASRRNERSRSDFYERLWHNAAAEIGAEFVNHGESFFEVCLNGRRTFIWQGLVQCDDPVTLKLAGNKPMVHKLISEQGIPVPRHIEFTVATINTAREFLASAQRACVVKPATDTGGGDGVTTHVRTTNDLHRASAFASLYGSRLLIEEQIRGHSYRLLYLDGTLLHALYRKPPHVTGNGRSTVRQLIHAENERRLRAAGSAAVTRLRIDPDCMATLQELGLSPASVVPQGKEIDVKTVVNENSAADNFTVTHEVGQQLICDGAKAARALGVRLAAVDVITADPSRSLAASHGTVIEVNTTPGLHHHYNVANPGTRDTIAVPLLQKLLENGVK